MNTDSCGVSWSQRFGAQCPKCGVYTKASYKHGVWNPGYKIRYHICPDTECGHHFKSVADDPASRDVEPDAEQLRFLRDYNGRRGGIKVAAGWLGLPGVGAQKEGVV